MCAAGGTRCATQGCTCTGRAAGQQGRTAAGQQGSRGGRLQGRTVCRLEPSAWRVEEGYVPAVADM
jgi:hypothetical protein